MSRRAHIWFLIAIVFLAIATVIGFTEAQKNLNDHKQFDKKVEEAVKLECYYAKQNRQIVVDVLMDLSHGSFLDSPSQQRLVQEANQVQARVEELKC